MFLGLFLWASFLLFSGPWLGTTTLLWGGVVMRLHLGWLFIFILLSPFLVFSRISELGFFYTTPLERVPRVVAFSLASRVSNVLAERDSPH